MREPGREPSNARDPRHTASIISGTTGTAHRVDGLSARRDAAPDPLTPRRRLVSAPSVAPALRPTTAPSRAWRVVRAVPDPELPALTIQDLGILRDVVEHDQGSVHVPITPTSPGIPAMGTPRGDIERGHPGAG